jgi:hypothetical protein
MTGFPPPNSGRGLWGNFTRHPIWAAVIAGLIVAGILGVIHHLSTPSVAAGSPHAGSPSPAQPIRLSNLPHPIKNHESFR